MASGNGGRSRPTNGSGAGNKPPGYTPRDMQTSSAGSVHGSHGDHSRNYTHPHQNAESRTLAGQDQTGNQARQTSDLSGMRSVNSRGTQNYSEDRGIRHQTSEQMQIRQQSAVDVQRGRAKQHTEVNRELESQVHRQAQHLHPQAQGLHSAGSVSSHASQRRSAQESSAPRNMQHRPRDMAAGSVRTHSADSQAGSTAARAAEAASRSEAWHQSSLSGMRSVNTRGTQNYGENRGQRLQTSEQMHIRRQTAVNAQRDAMRDRAESSRAAEEESLRQQETVTQGLHQQAQGVHDQAQGLHTNDAVHTGSKLDRFVDLGSKREANAANARTHKSSAGQSQTQAAPTEPSGKPPDKLKKKKKTVRKDAAGVSPAGGRTGLQRKVDLSMKREKLAESSGPHKRSRQISKRPTQADPNSKQLKKQVRHNSVKGQTRKKKEQQKQTQQAAMETAALAAAAVMQKSTKASAAAAVMQKSTKASAAAAQQTATAKTSTANALKAAVTGQKAADAKAADAQKAATAGSAQRGPGRAKQAAGEPTKSSEIKSAPSGAAKGSGSAAGAPAQTPAQEAAAHAAAGMQDALAGKPARSGRKAKAPEQVEAVRPVEAKARASGQSKDFAAKSAHGKQKVREADAWEESRTAKSAVHPDHAGTRLTPRQMLDQSGGVRHRSFTPHHIHGRRKVRSSHEIAGQHRRAMSPRQVRQKSAAIARYRRQREAAAAAHEQQMAAAAAAAGTAPVRRPTSGRSAASAQMGAAQWGSAKRAQAAAASKVKKKAHQIKRTQSAAGQTGEEQNKRLRDQKLVRTARQVAAGAAAGAAAVAGDIRKTATVTARNGNPEGAVMDRLTDQTKTTAERARKFVAKQIVQGWQKKRQKARDQMLQNARETAARTGAAAGAARKLVPAAAGAIAALGAMKAGAGESAFPGPLNAGQRSRLRQAAARFGTKTGDLARKLTKNIGKTALKGTAKGLAAGAKSILDAPKNASGVGPATSAEGKLSEKMEAGAKKALKDAAKGTAKGVQNLLKQKRLDRAAAKKAAELTGSVRPRNAIGPKRLNRSLPTAKEVAQNFKKKDLLSKARRKKALEKAAKAGDALRARNLTQKAATLKKTRKAMQKAAQKQAAQAAAARAGKGIFDLAARTEIIKKPLTKFLTMVFALAVVMMVITTVAMGVSFMGNNFAEYSGIGGLIKEDDVDDVGNMWTDLKDEFHADVDARADEVEETYRLTGPRDEYYFHVQWNGGDDGSEIDNFLDVLAVYAWETNLDPKEHPIDLAHMDDIRDFYRRLNIIEEPPEVVDEPIMEAELDADGNPTGAMIQVGTKRNVTLKVHNYKLHDQYVKDEFGYDDDTITRLREWIEPPNEKARVLWELLKDPIMEHLGMTFETASGIYNFSAIMGILPYGSAGAVLQECQKYLGWEYSQTDRWGYHKADCASFVWLVYNAFDVDFGGNTTSVTEYEWCRDQGLLFDFTDVSALEPGDVLFFRENGCHCGRVDEIHHVAIYAGEGKLYEASSGLGYVCYRDIWGVSGGGWGKIVAVARLISSTDFHWDGTLQPLNMYGQVLTGGRIVSVPSDVTQCGLCGEHTPIFDQHGFSGSEVSSAIYQHWLSKGSPFDGQVAMLDGCYLVALSPEKVCNEGWRVSIILEDGTVIPAITLDEKGPDHVTEDSDSLWGHMQAGGVSLVEWEGTAHAGTFLDAKGWHRKKVQAIVIHGRYV